MAVSGKEKLARIRDGRTLYIGAERVMDVTTHDALRNAAGTVAALFDHMSDPAMHDIFTFEEGGERYGLHWLQCRTRDDLSRRTRALKAIADATYGLIGRSPDHVAGLVTGLSMNPGVLESVGKGFGDNLTRYYNFARREDLYLSFAVTAPSGVRGRELS